MRKYQYIYLSLLSLMFSFILLHNATPHCHHEHEEEHQHSLLGLLLSHHNHSVEGDLQVKQYLGSEKTKLKLNQKISQKLIFLSSEPLLQKRSFSWNEIQKSTTLEAPRLHKNLFLRQKIPWRGPPTFA